MPERTLTAHVRVRIPVFDLDGTLVDSDESLIAPFLALGVPRDDITFGHVLADECTRLGIDIDDYLARYDTEQAQSYPGVDALLSRFERWAVCSNKHPSSGRAELARLGWHPEVSLFSDAFDGPKRLAPVLAALGVDAESVVFVGNTAHDRSLAEAAGVPFGLAAWNRRAEARPGDVVLSRPRDVLAFCGMEISPSPG